jgi:hypothetical protein
MYCLEMVIFYTEIISENIIQLIYYDLYYALAGSYTIIHLYSMHFSGGNTLKYSVCAIH